MTMVRIPLLVGSILCACLAIAACHSPSARPTVAVAAPRVERADTGSSTTQHAAVRQVEVLRQLVAMDRKSVELGELRVAEIRGLVQAGRSGHVDLVAAELELLEQRRSLLLRELELERAQEAAAASPPSTRGLSPQRGSGT
jgi:hypothetical protein